MNREELLRAREIYIERIPLRIVENWFNEYVKNERTSIVMSDYDDEVREKVKEMLEQQGFKVKVEGGGVCFDGYPDDTYFYIENV